ncbi:MAG: NYN domain-containing protein [Acidimicrobiia bacterium]
MPPTHLVVDGSNIATEGRSLPSLQQLLEAVDAVTAEFDHANVTVIVDATFGHRIDASEREQYEEKVNSGQIITPPAGVIGRGDAFILEVADRADAIILSNDSFQEFHGTYDWLFTEGRLIGGKHVPGVGWIFLARSPVRGPTSRRAVSDAKRKRRGSKQAASTTPTSKRPASSGSKSSSSRSGSSRAKASGSTKSAARAKDQARTDEPAGRKRGGKEPEPYNEPLPFIEFVGAHPVGSVIEAEIEQFASHGAYVVCDGTRCYISLKSIADPPPRSAREVFELGETREFVVKAIDTPRRGIDLAMPGMDLDAPDDQPEDDEPVDDESVEAELDTSAEPSEPVLVAAQAPTEDDGDRKLSVSQRRKLRAQQQAEAAAAAAAAAEEAAAPAKKAASRTRARAAAKKAAPDPKATDRKATSDMATKKAATKKKAAAKKAATKKKAAPAKTAAAKKATTAKKAPAKKAAAKKATATKAATKKKAAPAKKAAAKKASTAKKAPAKKAAAKKATATKAAPVSRAKKSTAKKAATKRA